LLRTEHAQAKSSDRVGQVRFTLDVEFGATRRTLRRFPRGHLLEVPAISLGARPEAERLVEHAMAVEPGLGLLALGLWPR